jgi:hypothetical protein
MFDMSKVRSCIALDWDIDDTWAPLISSFKLLRVLNIGGYYSNVCYLPKLRQLVLTRSMVLFVANKGDDGKKSVSFHIWDGKVDDSITKQPSASDSELQGEDESSSVFQWQTGRMCPLFLMKANVQQHLDSCQASKCFISVSVRRPSGTILTAATASAWNSSLRSGKSAFVPVPWK